jgi:hypothetical protein
MDSALTEPVGDTAMILCPLPGVFTDSAPDDSYRTQWWIVDRGMVMHYDYKANTAAGFDFVCFAMC